MPHKKKIPHRNQNHTDWWIFTQVAYWVSRSQKKLAPSSRCLVWENLRLLKAKNREGAYTKALKLASRGYPWKTTGGEWRFAGIGMLLPIYEKIEDGSELLWEEHKSMSMRKIRKLVKTKRKLSIFDDSEA